MPGAVNSAVVTCPLKACGIDVRVLRADTRVPVDGAKVLLEERGETKSLGAAGAVSFEQLPAGDYTAIVSEASIESEIVRDLPRSGATSVTEGKRAAIEILVDIQDWLLTTVVITGGEAPGDAPDGEGGGPEDWQLTTVEMTGDLVGDGDGAGDSQAPPAQDWKVHTVDITGDSSSDGDGSGDEPPDAPPEGATWKLTETEIGGPED